MRGDAAPATSRLQVFFTSLAFVLGFSLVFIALGASATAVGKFMFSKLPLLSKIAGVILIIFGLHTMGVFRLAFLETEKRVHPQRKPAGPLGAMLVGVAFAFGWTPCIGPILGGILAIAGSKNSVGGRHHAARGLFARPRDSVPDDVARDQPVLRRREADPASTTTPSS